MNPIEQEVQAVSAAFARGPEYGYAKLLYALNRIYRLGHEDAYRSFESEWQHALNKWGESDEAGDQAREDADTYRSILERTVQVLRDHELFVLAGEIDHALTHREFAEKVARAPDTSGDPETSHTQDETGFAEERQCSAFSVEGDRCTLSVNHDGWHRCRENGRLVRSWRPAHDYEGPGAT